MSGVFDSGSIQSQIIFPENISGQSPIYNGVPLPKEYDKMDRSAQDLYLSVYQQSQLQNFPPKKCHREALEAVKRTHIIVDGKYVLPPPGW